MTDASQDEKLSAVERSHGIGAYARYFKLLETVARQMDETDNCTVTYHASVWCLSLRYSRRDHCLSMLQALAKHGLCSLSADGELWTVTVPNLVKIRARKKPIGSKTRHTEVEVEVEVEVENKPELKNSSGPPKPFLDDNFQWQNISPPQVDRWQEAYPACDIRMELSKMASYMQANPTKRKKNWGRFIVNWLSRTQDNGGTKGTKNSVSEMPNRRHLIREYFRKKGRSGWTQQEERDAWQDIKGKNFSC